METQAQLLSKAQEFKRGWLVLLSCFIGVGVSVTAIGGYTSGVFVGPLENEFGWSRAEIAVHTFLSVAAMAVISPFIGHIIDRFGIRIVVVISALLYAICLYGLSTLSGSLVEYYALTITLTLMASATTPVSYSKAINAWFEKARGLALGITLLGAGVTAALGPILLTHLVDNVGWREGYQALGALVVMGAVIVFLFLRDAPDGQMLKAQPIDSIRAAQDSFSVKTLFTDKTFLLLAVIFFLAAIAVGGFTLHLIPMLTDEGLSREAAAHYASLVGVSVIIGRLGTGYLIDQFFAPKVAAILFGLGAIGYFTFLFGGLNYAAILAIAVGFTAGAEIDLIGYMVARYFGMRFYGVIYGALYSVFVIGAGSAPVIIGMIYDNFGAYDIGLMLTAISLTLSAICLLLLAPFPKQSSG